MELKESYNWLAAAQSYQEASNLAIEAQDFLKVADICEWTAYSFYRAALQAETNPEFKNRMTLSAKTYQTMIEILEKIQVEEAKLNHAKAMVAWTHSWMESDFSRMEALLDEWWNLENKTLGIYETKGDLLAFGRGCNNLLEGSIYARMFLNAKEFCERTLFGAQLGEKAIRALLKTDSNYELARAYCLTAWCYGIISFYYIIKKDEQITNLKEKMQEFAKKWLTYSDRALSLSERIGDAWLIGWSHDAKGLGLNKGITPVKLLYHNRELIKQGELTKDNYLLSKGFWGLSLGIVAYSGSRGDPEKRRYELRRAAELSKEALRRSRLFAFHIGILLSQHYNVSSLTILANLEVNMDEKRRLVQEAVKIGKESFEYARRFLDQGQIWTHFSHPFAALSEALLMLSQTETRIEKKKLLLEQVLRIREECLKIFLKLGTPIGVDSSFSRISMGVIQSELAEISASKKKIELFTKAVFSVEKGLEIFRKQIELQPRANLLQALHYGRLHSILGRILIKFYKIKDEKDLLDKAMEAYKNAAAQFRNAGLPRHSANASWIIAKIQDRMTNFLEAAESYEKAAEEYQKAAKKVPSLRDFYQDHSLYMKAWSQIERARSFHSLEQYDEAKNHYETAAKLHKDSERWSYLAPNYQAWAKFEQAEDLSRKEKIGEAKQKFRQAIEKFTEAEILVKEELKKVHITEEQEMLANMVKSADLRQKFCQARIRIEEAKILDMKGQYDRSSKSYRMAAETIKKIVDDADDEKMRKELSLIRVLCQAWEKMEKAEEKNSSQLYSMAATLFEEGRKISLNKRTSLLASGNSSFCKGLASGTEFEQSLDTANHSLAKRHMERAATYYLKAGFRSGSEYAKATLRLLDAYLYMNNAEGETDPDRRVKFYNIAEKLLQASAGSFAKAGQPQKRVEVQKILEAVREEKEFAITLADLLHAPAVASTTLSFGAITTSEESVGLESFEHANVQANLIAGMKEVKVGEFFYLSVEFVNAGKEPALLTKIEDFVPPNFVVAKKPEIYQLEDTCLNMKGKQIAPLKLVEAKLVLQPSKKGIYQLKPTVHYLDELGQNKSLQLKSVEIKVEEVILADRISTGTKELDSLLLGGIPNEYSIVLAGPPSYEREIIIKNFLEAGTKEGQTSFYVTTEAIEIEKLFEQSDFYLFLCNPKPKNPVPELPNITWLKSKTDLNNLNMALVRASRKIQQKQTPKRIVIENISDVLLKDGPEITRRWLSELTTDLVTKGFTVLAVLDSGMHTSEEANAIAYLFDGEINLYQTEDPLECKKSLRVKKLRNQDYIKNPICLT